MSDAVLGILKLCLLALIYLFLARVVWVVLRELRTEPLPAGVAPAPPRPERRRRSVAPPNAATHPHRIAVRHSDGRTEEIVVAHEATVGRGAGCTVVVADTFASQVHARLTGDGTGLRVEDLGSTNGTFVNERRIDSAVDLRVGDVVRIGQSTLEVRA